MTIWYLPLEHVDMRYTAHLDASIMACLEADTSHHQVVRLDPTVSWAQKGIEQGSFLDAPTTIGYKAAQLSMLAEAFNQSEVCDGDLIFVSDLWFPGLEALGYLAHFAGIDVRLRGFAHAGTWTPGDPVVSLESWAYAMEAAIFEQCETIFVGSDHAKRLLTDAHALWKGSKQAGTRVQVTGLPLDPALHDVKRKAIREPIVVFTGRDSPDKRPDLWDNFVYSFRQRHPDTEVQFIWTVKGALPRAEYLDLLSRAAAVVSFAEQENFGFAVREAMALGCMPVVPDALAYPEFVPDACRYDPAAPIAGAMTLVEDALHHRKPYLGAVDDHAHAPAIWIGGLS